MRDLANCIRHLGTPRRARGGPRSIAARASSVLATQIAVTEIAAPTGDEGRRAEWMRDRFLSLGLTGVHVDDAGNVIGTRPGARGARNLDEPALVVCAHLDTVFPADARVAARREGTRVYAPGIGDNGRGLAALLAVAGAIDGRAVKTVRPVRFVATTGEEGRGDLRGAKHHFATGGAAAAAIALDGTGDERIVHRAVGSRRLRVTLDGPGGHSWSDYGAVNPVHAGAAAIARIAALPVSSAPRTTLTVARVGGGLSVNSIPPSAWFEVDIRSTSSDAVHRLETALRGIVEAAAFEANAVRPPQSAALATRIDVIGDRPAGEIAASHPLVEAAEVATRAIGRTPELATASTDANVPLSLGIPAIAIGGGGRGGDVHTIDEWYEDVDAGRGLERALTIVVAAAS